MKKYVINTYPSVIQFVTECYKTKKTCDKAVYTFLLYLILFLIDIRLKQCVIKLFLMTILC